MLFNSYIFIFVFLPVVLFIFYKLGQIKVTQIALAWVIVASFIFYGWWKPIYLLLLAASILFNYGVGYCILKTPKSEKFELTRKIVLTIGVGLNIVLLGYYKYSNFFAENINNILATDYNLKTVFIPLGISFYTFTQIAYLVDMYRGAVREYGLLNYTLFVTFFPHLIAGPILHHSEMMPQFSNRNILRFNPINFSVGLSVFIIGLFKKVVFADGIAVFVAPIFDAATKGVLLTFIETWIGALAYTLQLYFDFSGYSEMALGLAFMLNIRMPLNFYSPYKAGNIIDFWRRWHMTLSRYLRDYLYIPLGGNRKGTIRRYINIVITMIIGGFWHGANWTFICWGLLHGLYLVINHTWLKFKKQLPFNKFIRSMHWQKKIIARGITFIAVVIGWVIFRADNLSAAKYILKGMIGLNGISLPVQLKIDWVILPDLGIRFDGLTPFVKFNSLSAIIWIGLLLLTVWFAPSVVEIFKRFKPFIHEDGVINFSGKSIFSWNLNIYWAITIGILFAICLVNLSSNSEFLYFQF